MLLGEVGFAGAASTHSTSPREIIEIRQRRQGRPRRSDSHADAGRSVEHPRRHHRDDARCHLDVDELPGLAPGLAIVDPLDPDAAAEKRMPAVVDQSILPDIGRMDGRWTGTATGTLPDDGVSKLQGAPGAETRDIGAPGAPVRERRMTARREQEAVLRVLRGEPLETVARELQVTAAALSGWRDAFFEAGEASLKARPEDDRDARSAQLQAKLGEVTMDNELLQERIERMEAGRPLARRRSRPTPRSRLLGDPGGPRGPRRR